MRRDPSVCLIVFVCRHVVGLVGLVFWVEAALVGLVWWLALVEFPRRNGSSMWHCLYRLEAANMHGVIFVYFVQRLDAGDICHFAMIFFTYESWIVLVLQIILLNRFKKDYSSELTTTKDGRIQLSLVEQINQRFSIMKINSMWCRVYYNNQSSFPFSVMLEAKCS